jgi:hypothetical protein
MSKRLLLVLTLVFAATSARADFDALVRAVESSRGLHRIWMPGMGFIRLAVRMVHPEGVHDLQLARFSGDGEINFDQVIRSTKAEPIIRTRERSGEMAFVWARPLHGDLIEMLVLAHDPNDETVVVRAVVNAEMLLKELADPKHPQAMIAGK